MMSDETAKKDNDVIDNESDNIKTVAEDITEDNVASLHLNNHDDDVSHQSQTRITELENEIAELKDKMLRAMAEAENTRRRAEKDKTDAGKFAISNFARNLLPVVDNLRRAIDATPEDLRNNNEMVKNLLIGIEATEKELLRAMENSGIKSINPLGEVFNPHFHEVMFESESSGQESGTIIQVIEVGYMIHDRLLRPARVGVVKGTPSDNHEFDTVA